MQQMITKPAVLSDYSRFGRTAFCQLADGSTVEVPLTGIDTPIKKQTPVEVLFGIPKNLTRVHPMALKLAA